MTGDFWLLRDPYSSEPLAESEGPSKLIFCEADPGHRRAGRSRPEKVTISTRPTDDFVWTWSNDILLSEPVLQVLLRNRITGFETKSVDVVWSRPTTETPPKLFELVVTGWGGKASPQSGLRIVKYCPSCRHRVYSVADPRCIIDPAMWDGSDFFMVWPLPGHRFVSDRLAKLIRQARFSGLALIRAADIPMQPGGTLAPGPLTNWMPQQRALELAKKFDVL
jgi:hypothetical protein